MTRLFAACLLLALAGAAYAQTGPAAPEEKPRLDTGPWSGSSTTKSDGLGGSTTTTIKRDMGDGLSIGGQMRTPYQDPALGGSGPPSNPLERSGGTTVGPVLEKKF